MVLKLAGLEKPQLNMMSVIVLLEWLSNFSAYCRRVLRMKACGVWLVSSFIRRCRCTRLSPTSRAIISTLRYSLSMLSLITFITCSISWSFGERFFSIAICLSLCLSLPINLFFKVRRTLSRLMMVRRRMSILNGFTT